MNHLSFSFLVLLSFFVEHIPQECPESLFSLEFWGHSPVFLASNNVSKTYHAILIWDTLYHTDFCFRIFSFSLMLWNISVMCLISYFHPLRELIENSGISYPCSRKFTQINFFSDFFSTIYFSFFLELLFFRWWTSWNSLLISLYFLFYFSSLF